MVNYTLGKIYQIFTLLGTEIYIGSTAEPTLARRMSKHRSSYKNWKNGGNSGKVMGFDIFDKYGEENCKIELIETFSCKSKTELEAREGFFQRQHRDKIVNKNIAGRTYAEYYLDTVEERKQHYQDNAEEISKWHKQNYLNNSVNILKRNAKYRTDNADEVKEKASVKITCSCGSITRHADRSKHLKTKKHQNFLKTSIQTVEV
jgi:exonuclease VII large subunit